MSTKKIESISYMKELNKISPSTLYYWHFTQDNKSLWTSRKKLEEINEYSFIKNENMYKTSLETKDSMEVRFDLDYKTFDLNLKYARKLCKALEKNNIFKYLVYFSGSVGIHICFRVFKDCSFSSFDKKAVRESLFKSLNVVCDIDLSLFNDSQGLVCEGWNNRKTNNPKQLIRLNEESLDFIGFIEPLYLTKDYINQLNKDLIKSLILNLNPILENKPSEIEIKPHNIDIIKLNWHIQRFKTLYNELVDGKKRLLDILNRYLYLTINDEVIIINILLNFYKSLGIPASENHLKNRLLQSLRSMTTKAIFIYKDVITKEEFYLNYAKEVLK